MRKPEFISPSALACYEESPEEYYLRYLADHKAPRMAQTPPMAVGSAFDAFVKNRLHEAIFGKNHPDSGKYGLKNLFEQQVEPQNRDHAWLAGFCCMQAYEKSGALADLLVELGQAADEPRFEFHIQSVVEGYRAGITQQRMGVVLMGKPDVRYVNAGGGHVVLDFKVNGYCGKGNVSPMPGYAMCRGMNGERFGPHKNYFPLNWSGTTINGFGYLEQQDESWATQLAVYGWLMGEPVGKEFVTAIEQLVCDGREQPPVIRVASHRTRISENFQFKVLARFQGLWGILNDIGTDKFYFFRDLRFEESRKKCAMLEQQASQMDSSDPLAQWVFDISRH